MTQKSYPPKKLLAAIEKEIKNHSKWCSPICQTFLPREYRIARLGGNSAKTVQRDYDLCHAFR